MHFFVFAILHRIHCSLSIFWRTFPPLVYFFCTSIQSDKKLLRVAWTVSLLGFFPLLCQKHICRSSEQPAAAISHAKICRQTIGRLRTYRSLLFLDYNFSLHYVFLVFVLKSNRTAPFRVTNNNSILQQYASFKYYPGFIC